MKDVAPSLSLKDVGFVKAVTDADIAGSCKATKLLVMVVVLSDDGDRMFQNRNGPVLGNNHPIPEGSKASMKV